MPVAGAPGTAAESAMGVTVICRPSRPVAGKDWRRSVSWFDTSAGSVAGVSSRWKAGLQAPFDRNDQRRPAGLTWASPPVPTQPTGSSAPAAQPAVLASPGTPAQAPPFCTARPDRVTLPRVASVVGASMLIIVTWQGHWVSAADSQPWCRAPRLTGTWPPSGEPSATTQKVRSVPCVIPAGLVTRTRTAADPAGSVTGGAAGGSRAGAIEAGGRSREPEGHCATRANRVGCTASSTAPLFV